MKKTVIDSLTQLNDEEIILGKSGGGKEYLFIINSTFHDEGTYQTKLKFIEINKYFTVWEMTLSTVCNEDKEFFSKNDSSYKFQFFKTGFTREQLSEVLIKYLSAN